MRITCLIDSLGSGGAQRQMALLAKGISDLGHAIHFITYYPQDFFRPLIESDQIKIELIKSSKLFRALAVRRAIKRSRPDAVISFLDTPNLLAEAAGLPSRSWKLIVSERSFGFLGGPLRKWIRLFFHRFSDVIVCNSRAQVQQIRDNAPELASKTLSIWNGLDLAEFSPGEAAVPLAEKEIRVLVLASVFPVKNPNGLLNGLQRFQRHNSGRKVVVDWYGSSVAKLDDDSLSASFYQQLTRDINRAGCTSSFRLHSCDRNVIPLYRACDVVCLPSLLEGCPNCICEAMACGKPILASRVGDIPRFVKEGVGGFLFDPTSPESIENALTCISQIDTIALVRMGMRNRQIAMTLFDYRRMVQDYLAIIESLPTR